MKNLTTAILFLCCFSAFAGANQAIQCETTLRYRDGAVRTEGKTINEAVKELSEKGYNVTIEDLKIATSAAAYGYSHTTSQGTTSRNEMVISIVEKCAILKVTK